MTTIVINRDDARAHPELVTALEAAGAEVLLVDWDPAEEVEVTIIEDDEAYRDSDWDRELGGASDGHTVHSDTDPGL